MPHRRGSEDDLALLAAEQHLEAGLRNAANGIMANTKEDAASQRKLLIQNLVELLGMSQADAEIQADLCRNSREERLRVDALFEKVDPTKPKRAMHA